MTTMTPDPNAPKPTPKPTAPTPGPIVGPVPDDTAELDQPTPPPGTVISYVEQLSTVDLAELRRLAFVLWEPGPADEPDDEKAIRKYAALKTAKTVLEYRHHWDEKRLDVSFPTAAEYAGRVA